MDPLKQLEKLAAVDTRVQLPTGKVRSAYYETGDGLVALEEAARTVFGGGDRTYNKLVADLQRTHNALYKHLNKYYLWD
jgi:hypothetical protein